MLESASSSARRRKRCTSACSRLRSMCRTRRVIVSANHTVSMNLGHKGRSQPDLTCFHSAIRVCNATLRVVSTSTREQTVPGQCTLPRVLHGHVRSAALHLFSLQRAHLSSMGRHCQRRAPLQSTGTMSETYLMTTCRLPRPICQTNASLRSLGRRLSSRARSALPLT